MTNRRNGSEYIPLMTDDGPESTPILEETKGEAAIRPPTSSSPRTLNISVTLTFLISLTSLGITLISSLAAWNRGSGQIDVNSLRHPSLYIGLDRVPKIKQALMVQSALAAARPTVSMSTALPPVQTPVLAIGPTSPFKSFRVSSTYPDQTSPVDGWILITEKDTTLMEFYLPVSGFTQCTLMGFFPERRQLASKLLTLEGDTSAIDVWDVSTAQSFNASNVTWNSKPPRKLSLGSISAVFGANGTTEPFHCLQGFPMILELSCSRPGCRVEFKEERGPPRLGFEIIPK